MINPGGLATSDEGALNEEQRVKLRQLKVNCEQLDQKYIRAHPELDVMVYEFVREVLHKRPDSISTFAADWFSSPLLREHIETRMAKGKPDRELDFINDLKPMKF